MWPSSPMARSSSAARLMSAIFRSFLPVVGVSSIGAGGGSIAWLDGAGVLKVGPRSAGADPGPACYGLGGEEPTLSDAFLLCGYLNPGDLPGRRAWTKLRRPWRWAGWRVQLALGLSETASAVIQVALATMFTEFSAVLERRGIDPRDFTLVAFGGAGPVLPAARRGGEDFARAGAACPRHACALGAPCGCRCRLYSQCPLAARPAGPAGGSPRNGRSPGPGR